MLLKDASPSQRELLTHHHTRALEALELGTLGDGLVLTSPATFHTGEVIVVEGKSCALHTLHHTSKDLVHATAQLGDTSHQVEVFIATSPQQHKQLERASDTLARLFSSDAPQHKHLPRRIAAGDIEDHGHRTLILEHEPFTHPTLRELLAHSPSLCDPEHMIWVLRRALSVIGWAHKMGVVHGNVCPDTLRVNAANHNVWLVDWGYAVIDPARTKQGFTFTNPDFSPPEVRERKPPLPSSDLYALGHTMLWLLKGGHTSRPLPDEIPVEIARLLTFMTLQSPTGRARDAWELYHEVERIRRHLYGQHRFKAVT